ncbi:MAG: hypothetical protein LQ350_007923, partial [Teloschistes chrysophthalmus]
LPYELIDKIGRLLTLPELKAFASISRFIHEATVPIFHEWGNTYRSLSFPRYEEHEDSTRSATRDLSFFLATILDHPFLRYYPIDLKIGQWQESTDVFDADTEERRNQAEQKLNTNFTKLIDICHLDIWSIQLDCHNVQSYISSITCLLFVLLPNLETIRFASTFDGVKEPVHDLSRLKTLVQAIADANRDSTSLCHNKALAQLRTFHYDYIYDSPFEAIVNEPIGLLETVAMIPSLRDLNGVNLMGLPGTLNIAPDTSNVTNLGLRDCSVSVEAFEVLLRGFKCLEGFSYTHSCGICDYEEGSPYNAPGIVKALGDNAARSLKSLHLEAMLYEDLQYGEDQQYIGPLHMFQSLRSIHVQDQVFRIWEIDDKSSDENVQDQVFRTSEDKGRLSDESVDLVPYSQRGVPYRMDQLENILPQSVETVRLVQTMDNDHVARILQGLTGKGKQRMPHLTHLEFVYRIPFGDIMKKSLEDGGIEIISLEDRARPCELNSMGFET